MITLAIVLAVLALVLGYFAVLPGHFLQLASSSVDMEPEAREQFKSTMRVMMAGSTLVCALLAGYFWYSQEDPAAARARQQQQQEKENLVKKYGAGSMYMVESPNSPLHKKSGN